MKKLKLLLLVLAALAVAYADGPIAGQKTVQLNLVTWSNSGGNWSNKTRLLFLGNNVYVDTSATGQAGQFKRVDNTADSCSNPFLLTADTNGTTRPIFQSPLLWEIVRSVDKDSSTHVYRLQTRERFYNATSKTIAVTPWTEKGTGTGYADFTVSDSILIANAGTTNKISQYGMGSVFGSQARLCPDDVSATANAAGDSIFADSLRAFTR